MKHLLIILFFWINCLPVSSQIIERQIVSTTGGYTATDDGIISFTLGDLAIIPLTKDEIILHQGFEKGEANLILGLTHIPRDVAVYPNPTTGKTHIQLEDPFGHQLQINIFNLLGEKILSAEFLKAPLLIDISGQTNGVYLVKILDVISGESETLRLIKK